MANDRLVELLEKGYDALTVEEKKELRDLIDADIKAGEGTPAEGTPAEEEKKEEV